MFQAENLVNLHYCSRSTANPDEDIRRARCHHDHEDEVKTEVISLDDRAYTFSGCHAKDIVCNGMQDGRFKSDLYAGTKNTFFGLGKALIIIDTECLDTFEYYLISIYWSGKIFSCKG